MRNVILFFDLVQGLIILACLVTYVVLPIVIAGLIWRDWRMGKPERIEPKPYDIHEEVDLFMESLEESR